MTLDDCQLKVFAYDSIGGRTVLMYAIQCIDFEAGLKIVRLFIKEGADVNMRSSSGLTGKQSTNLAVVFLINTNTLLVLTALLLAARLGKVEIVSLLLDNGADINTKDNNGVCSPFPYFHSK